MRDLISKVAAKDDGCRVNGSTFVGAAVENMGVTDFRFMSLEEVRVRAYTLTCPII
jgi:hypothetical protein